jgi:hypothetical protein
MISGANSKIEKFKRSGPLKDTGEDKGFLVWEIVGGG